MSKSVLLTRSLCFSRWRRGGRDHEVRDRDERRVRALQGADAGGCGERSRVQLPFTFAGIKSCFFVLAIKRRMLNRRYISFCVILWAFFLAPLSVLNALTYGLSTYLLDLFGEGRYGNCNPVPVLSQVAPKHTAAGSSIDKAISPELEPQVEVRRSADCAGVRGHWRSCVGFSSGMFGGAVGFRGGMHVRMTCFRKYLESLPGLE